jgi:hypothetical protein
MLLALATGGYRRWEEEQKTRHLEAFGFVTTVFFPRPDLSCPLRLRVAYRCWVMYGLGR